MDGMRPYRGRLSWHLTVLALVVAGCTTGAVTPGPSTPTATPLPRGSIVFTQESYSCLTGGDWGFVASLSDRAGGLVVTLVLARASATGGETVVTSTDLKMATPDISEFTDGPVSLSSFCQSFPLGNYVARIVRSSDAKVLAAGRFVLTK